MHYLGITSTALTDGSTASTVVVSGNNKTAANGDVVICDHKEFIWNGTSWELLGDETSYKLLQEAVANPTASTTNSLTFI